MPASPALERSNLPKLRRMCEEVDRLETELSTLWNLSRDILSIFDPKHNVFVRFSPAVKRVLGYEPKELEGQDWLHLIHPEDVNRTLVAAGEIAEGKVVEDFVNRIQHADGSYRFLEWTSVRAKDGLFYGIARDITHRLQNEEHTRKLIDAAHAAELNLHIIDTRFQAFMDHAPFVAWMKEYSTDDPEEYGRYVYMSRPYARRFDLNWPNDYGRNDLELWGEETAEVYRKNDRFVLETGQVLETVEIGGGLHSDCIWLIVKFPIDPSTGKRYVGGIGLEVPDLERFQLRVQHAGVPHL